MVRPAPIVSPLIYTGNPNSPTKGKVHISLRAMHVKIVQA